MSIFENSFNKKAASTERQEPKPLAPERAAANEAVDPNEPTFTMPQPEQVFAQEPETVEQEAERRFNRIALESNMSPDDLRSLESYTMYETVNGYPVAMQGIRGRINGMAVDIRYQWNAGHNASEVVATIGDRMLGGQEAFDEFNRLSEVRRRRTQWAKANEAAKDERALAQVQSIDVPPFSGLAADESTNEAPPLVAPSIEQPVTAPALSIEDQAERQIIDEFNAIAEKFKMSPEELRDLEHYKTEQESTNLHGVRGTQNGVPFDIREQANPLSLTEVHLWGSIGGREMPVNSYELSRQWAHISKALNARETWEHNAGHTRTAAVVKRMRG
ncbi:MAG: hypothetical protein Q7S95_01805 [bacterium]|nr:hypothetical protein [bacterium]